MRGVWLALVMLVSACEASVGAGAQCTRSSECPTPLVCAIGRCRAGCGDSRDCPALARCLVEPTTMTRVCSLPSTDDCAAHDCAVGFACRAGACVNVCGGIVRCPDGVCEGDTCVPTRAGPVDAGPSDAPVATRWTIAIADDGDDGELDTTTVWRDGENDMDVDFAGSWAGARTWAFARFALPAAIPAGARVMEAHLVVNSAGVSGVVTDANHLAVVLDDAGDAPAVARADAFPGGGTGLSPTTAIVLWGPLTAWPVTSATSSPDLAPLLQEVIDHQAGLAAGAHVRFWIDASDYTTDGEVSWQDTVAGAGGPTLVVTWSPP